MLNGNELGGRKINVNWAMPIKDYKFQQERSNALHLNEKRIRMNKLINGKHDKIKVDDDSHESIAFKKIKKWQSKRKKLAEKRRKIKNANKKSRMKIQEEEIGDETNKTKETKKTTETKKTNIKNNRKRKQKWAKPSTKKIKLTL